MIRTLIIDDEEDARYVLRKMLEKHFPAIGVQAEAGDYESGLEAIRTHDPDLVFLDIKLGDRSGFDLLKALDGIRAEIIFVTAYDDFALNAFKFAAFGYLLKPVKLEELQQLIGKLTHYLEDGRDSLSGRVKVLIESHDRNEVKKLVLPHRSGFRVVALSDMIRLEGDTNYTRFILKDGEKHLVSKTIGEYEELLADHGFLRVHQSSIVNLAYVVGYQRGDGGTVTMADGAEIRVSRSRKKALLDRFL